MAHPAPVDPKINILVDFLGNPITASPTNYAVQIQRNPHFPARSGRFTISPIFGIGLNYALSIHFRLKPNRKQALLAFKTLCRYEIGLDKNQFAVYNKNIPPRDGGV